MNMNEDVRNPQSAFINLRGDWFRKDAIMAVRRTKKPGKGKDNVKRDIVVVVKEDVVCPPFNEIWANDEEAADLLQALNDGTI